MKGTMYAEHIRGPVVSIISLQKDMLEENSEAVLRIGDLSFIELRENNPLLQGIELEISIPSVIKNYGNAVEFILYKNVDPKPSTNIMGYEGDQIHNEILSGSGRFFIQIPLIDQHRMLSSSEAALVSSTADEDDFPILFAFYPVGKGFDVPKTLNFSVKPKPVYLDKGGISIVFLDENNRKLNQNTENLDLLISINEEILTDIPHVLYMNTGFHKLTLRSDTYEDEDYTFGIEKGVINKITIPLVRALSKLNIIAPKNGTLILDGEILSHNSGTSVFVKPGEHEIKLKTERYTLSKRFNVKKKTDYTISFALDVIIKEDN